MRISLVGDHDLWDHIRFLIVVNVLRYSGEWIRGGAKAGRPRRMLSAAEEGHDGLESALRSC